MKKARRKISSIMVVIYILMITVTFNNTVNAEENTKQSEDAMVTLVGDFVEKQGLGKNWDPTNSKTIMKEFRDGLYELTVDFKTTGTYNYKATINGKWDESYGKNGKNKSIKILKPCKVTFKFNYKNKGDVLDSINDKDKFKSVASLVGNLESTGGQSWNPNDTKFDLDYRGESFFVKTFDLKKGNYEYKIAYDHKWSNGEVKNNVKLNLDKDQKVTFISNPDLGICMDSINSPECLKNLSLIGTIRTLGDKDWDVNEKSFEFLNLNNEGKFIYSGFFKKGNYEYKALKNYNWNEDPIPEGGNAKISVPEGGKYIIFIADVKNNRIIDSINNNAEVAKMLGFTTVPAKENVTNPIVNGDGTVTFNYKNNAANKVYLAGSMTSWEDGKKLMKNNKGIWSLTLRMPDKGARYQYKFIVDGKHITDPNNKKIVDGNSSFTLSDFTGRKVVLAGTIQTVAGESAWTPGSDKTAFKYDGNGKYSLVLKNVPQGSYEYKVAMGSWDENYGANGEKDGGNIHLQVNTSKDVKFTYFDDEHVVIDSITFQQLNIKLEGTGVPKGTVMKPNYLTGVYSAKVNLNKGTYRDIKAVLEGIKYPFGKIEITDESKEITFKFDPKTKMVFCDASNMKIDRDKINYNSREIQYKKPYGAVKKGEKVEFNLKAGKNNLIAAKLVIQTPEKTQFIEMKKNDTFEDDKTGEYDRWTAEYIPTKISMNKYYFIVSNGSDVKAYGDDDGYYGKGKADELGKVKTYGLNVYDPNFKTPDWMKNAVVYQIFPDRFFNGDKSNDEAQKLARGNNAYEFYEDWNAIPEDPDLEDKEDIEEYKKNNGTIGDGVWCNEIYGGDLKGVSDKLDYLQKLGVNVLYFNPVSQSISSHRYDTSDYTKIDPILGHMDDFIKLAKEAHKRNMKIILDGVFNHVSDDSIYFDRYGKFMEKGKALGAYQYWGKVYDLVNNTGLSKEEAEKKTVEYFTAKGITDFHYKDWFNIENKKVKASKESPEHYKYEGWWGFDSMPIIKALDGSEYKVKSWADEIIDGKNSNSRLWLRQGSNGWRLDVANEVSDETWQKFRKAVKEEGDNVIIGEIWDDASKYLLGDMYDSVMNYRFRQAVIEFATGKDVDGKNNVDASTVMNELEVMREQYPKEAFYAMLNLVGSHDTQRIISALDGYKKSEKVVAKEPTKEAFSKMKLVSFLQMTYPGAPCIYYGDELGMAGGDDPDNRRGMTWDKLNTPENKELFNWYSKLTSIRNSNEVLRTGDILPLTVPDEFKKDVISYMRKDDTNAAVIVANRAVKDITNLQLSVKGIEDGTNLTNALNADEKYTVKDGKITVNVKGQTGIILIAEIKESHNSKIDDDKNSKEDNHKIDENKDNKEDNTKIDNKNHNEKTIDNGNIKTDTSNSIEENNSKNTISKIQNNNIGKTSDVLKLPQTGTFMDNWMLIVLGIVALAVGLLFIVVSKNKRISKK